MAPQHQSSFSVVLVSALAVALHAVTAAAQTPPGDLTTASLDDLLRVRITTASRTPEILTDAPALVEVVTAKEIRDRGYRSLLDVLKDRAKFKADVAGDQDYPTQLTVQGTRGANRIVLLLDGIRVSSPTGEPLPILSNYPVHLAKRIEIVYGPASAVYGADAFSGVINIVSKDIGEAEGLSVTTSAGQYGLQNYTASFGASVGARGTLVVSGQVLNDAQPEMSRFYPEDFKGMEAQRAGIFNSIFGPMRPTGSVPAAYSAPIQSHSLQALYRRNGLQISLFENRSRVPTSPAYTPDNAVYSDQAFNDNRLLVGAVGYTAVRNHLTSTTTLTLSRHELSPASGYFNVYSNFQKSFKFAFGAMAKAEQIVAWEPSARTTLTVGGTLEAFYSIPQGADLNASVESRSQPVTILDTNIVDDFIKVRYTNSGAFAQLRQKLTPRFSVTIGARGDYNSRYGATFNPSFGLVATPRPATTLKLLYGTAFLAPSPYQAHSHYGAFYSVDGGATYQSEFWHLGNPGLEPEYESTVQATVQQAVGKFFNVSGSVFRSRVTNIIQESDDALAYAGTYHGWPVAYIEFPVNEGRQVSYGGSLDVEWLRSWSSDRRLRADVGLSLADGRQRDNVTGEDLPLGAMAPRQLRAGADLDWGKWTTSIRVASVGAQRLVATQSIDGLDVRRTLPGYTTANLNVRRRTLFKNVDVFLTVENLFDARYRNINARAYNNPEELIGAPQNPRRVVVGLDLRIR